MLKKKYLYPIIIVYIILITVLIMTAINPQIDLYVSDALTSGGSFTFILGNVFEMWTEPIIFIPACFILTMAAVYCIRFDQKKKLPKIVGLCIIAGSAGIMFYMFRRMVKYYINLTDITNFSWTYKPDEKISVPLWGDALCVLGGVAVICVMYLIAVRIKQETIARAGKTIIFVAVAMLISLAVMEGLKLLWGRPRYRLLMTDETYSFSPWYQPHGLSSYQDLEKSFPSAHTSNTLLLLPMTFIFDAVGKEKLGKVLRVCHICLLVFIMATRIMAGAHFLSDVCAGALIAFTIVILSSLLVFRDWKFLKKLNIE